MNNAATNSSGGPIYPGMALHITGERAVLAGGDVLANAVATTGAQPRTTVTYITTGILDMRSWKLSADTDKLIPGAPYYVGVGGKLVESQDYGQAIGQAISPEALSIQISTVIVPPEFTVVEDPLPRIWATSGVPTHDLGNVGDIAFGRFIDFETGVYDYTYDYIYHTYYYYTYDFVEHITSTGPRAHLVGATR